MSKQFDPHDASVGDDIEKFRELRRRDSGGWVKVELIFGSLTALVGLVWFVSIIFVPDQIDGAAWMGLGMLGLGLFGAPTAAIYWLRRGGIVTCKRVIRAGARSLRGWTQ
jgi:hypothetical protein